MTLPVAGFVMIPVRVAWAATALPPIHSGSVSRSRYVSAVFFILPAPFPDRCGLSALHSLAAHVPDRCGLSALHSLAAHVPDRCGLSALHSLAAHVPDRCGLSALAAHGISQPASR